MQLDWIYFRVRGSLWNLRFSIFSKLQVIQIFLVHVSTLRLARPEMLNDFIKNSGGGEYKCDLFDTLPQYIPPSITIKGNKEKSMRLILKREKIQRDICVV
jgi:hypothetical protein